MDLNLALEQVKGPDQAPQQQQQQQQQQPSPIKLTDVKVTDENIALNLLVSFISLAQKRGTFTIDESAKIWECISLFSKSGAK
jgi:hypothetical protein